MSLTDIVRNVAKSVRETLSDRELREKAKDLPLQILQGVLTGVGQALRLGGRLRSKLQSLGEQREETERPSVEEQLSRTAPKQNGTATEKKTKREPVIFAPRPAKPEETPTNGAAPTTTEPAKATEAAAAEPESAKAAEPTTTTEPEPEPTKAAAEPATTEPEPTKATEPTTTEPEPTKATEPTTTEPEPTKAAAEPAPVESEPAKVTEPTTEPEPAPAADAGELAKAAAATPTEAEPVAAETTPAAEPVASDAVTTTPPLAEPLPGYANLTMASLRARLRNKSADDIRALIAYEKATSNRPNIIKMYENRLAKITATE